MLTGRGETERETLLYYLREAGDDERAHLYREADSVRKSCTGDRVHVRALLNISSYCRRNCLYCGLRAGNTGLARYRLGEEEILDTAGKAAEKGYRTIVMQSGEDPGLTPDFISSIVRSIVTRFGLTVTLSLGERPESVLRQWYDAGARRYLLKHETSDPVLYGRLNPGMSYRDRIEMLETLKKIGYQAGSGVMIGLPGQTWESLAGDILLMKKLDIDMIGCGPWIANPDTPLGREPAPGEVIADEKTVLTVTALNRIVMRDVLIAATTATKTLYRDGGLYRALRAGANVVMLDVTPPHRGRDYLIYPGKKAVNGITDAEALWRELRENTGLDIATDAGDRPRCQS